MRLFALVRAAVLAPAAVFPVWSVAAEEPVTEVRVYQLHRDDHLVVTEVGASARVEDTPLTGIPQTVAFRFATGEAMGRVEEGFPQLAIGETSFGAFTVQSFGPSEVLPEGPCTITFEGGSLDGWTAVHELALAWLPRRPDVTTGTLQKLESHVGRKPLKLQLNGFTPRRGAAAAQSYLYLEWSEADGNGGRAYQTIFQRDELPAATRSVELPADTLVPGHYRLNLVHVQTSPAEGDLRPVTYYSAHVLEFTRTR